MSSSTQELHTAATELPSGTAVPTRWLALTALLTGAFLPILDFTIVNLALPSIRQSLGANSAQVQFVISAYAATYAVMLITGGRLGDLLGRKRMFLIGVAGFSVPLFCVDSQHFRRRLFWDVFLTLWLRSWPRRSWHLFASCSLVRNKASPGVIWSNVWVSEHCGQLLGGFLVFSHPFGYSWQSIFFINIPIGIVAFVGAVFFVRKAGLYMQENWISSALFCYR